MFRLLPAVLLVAGASCAPLPSPAQSGTPALSVADAREAGVGATVLLDGVVSVPPGIFDGGFAVQDRTGGLWVLPPSTGVPLVLGQRVRVHGTLDAPDGQLSLHPSAIQPLGMRPPPEPRVLHTGAVDGAAEGWLVRVRGRVSEDRVDDPPWGWSVTLDDGSGAVTVFASARTDVDATPFAPGALLEVTGFVGRYGEALELRPRGRVDVRPAAAP